MSADPESRASGGPRGGAWWIALLVVTTVAGVIRLWVAHGAAPVPLLGDEHYYLEVAKSIAAGGGHYSQRLEAFAAWPPGQAWWLSWFLPAHDHPGLSAQHAPAALLSAQALLGTVLVAGVGLLGRLLAGRRAGLGAAAGAAIYPTFVTFSHYLWATTLFTTLVVFAWCAVVLAERRGAVTYAAGAGALFGLAALTRETGAVLAVGSALWLCWRAAPAQRPRAAARGALLLALCALVVLPWTLRNLERTGRVIAVSTASWMALREGNTIHPENWMLKDIAELSAFRRRHAALPEAERIDLARREAIALVRAEQPRWILVKFVRNLAWLSGPDQFVLRKLYAGAYDAISPAVALVATAAAWVAVLSLGSLGLAISGRAGSFALFAALPLLLLHVVANASSRYRIPLEPLLLVGSALAVIHWGELGLRLRHLRPPVLALLLFVLALAVRQLVLVAFFLWNRGSLVAP